MIIKGINQAIILGTLGAEPQQVNFQDGNFIVNLSVATSDTWTDRNGNPQESIQWHKVRLSGKLAESGMRLLAKGSQVYVEGPIKTRKWVNKNNQTQYTTEIYAEKMELLSGGKQIRQDEADMSFQPKINQATKNSSPIAQATTNNINQDNDPGWIPF